jgi:hypothetical protein
MKKVARLLAILIVLLAASAVPSTAIIPICSEFCPVECPCDLTCTGYGCWESTTNTPMSCADWSANYDSSCGFTP